MNLTNRELEILQYICKEHTDEEIAKALFISISTVKWHVHKMLEKLDLRDRTQLVIYVFKNNIFTQKNKL